MGNSEVFWEPKELWPVKSRATPTPSTRGSLVQTYKGVDFEGTLLAESANIFWFSIPVIRGREGL